MNTNFHPVSTPDYLPVPQLRQLQLSRLKMIVRHAYDRVELFRTRMQKNNLTPDSIETLDDIAWMPFTQKIDLRDTYPFGLFAVDIHDVVRLHASSGTTGKPIVVAYSRDDIRVWANAMERCFASYGMGPRDIIQNAYGYGLFTGGLGAHYGGESLGATVIPISGGNTERQLMVMKDFGVTAICCTPSYFVHLIERIRPEIIDPDTGEPKLDGEEGELVLTTLSKYAMPMIRYRTRDITSIVPEPCACGRSLRRIRRISRRSDDMLIIRGVNVYPSQIETAMFRVEGTTPHYQIVLTRSHGLDQMAVQVEVTQAIFSDTVKAIEDARRRIRHEIESLTGIRVDVELVRPGTVPRSEGKARRVVDRRNV